MALFSIEGMARLMSLQRLSRGPVTPPGENGQMEVLATQFDKFGNPIIVVADGRVVNGETEGWIAVARLLLGAQDRVWKFKRRKRTPMIIGEGD